MKSKKGIGFLILILVIFILIFVSLNLYVQFTYGGLSNIFDLDKEDKIGEFLYQQEEQENEGSTDEEDSSDNGFNFKEKSSAIRWYNSSPA
jgi:hypothetical protein|tara:strand:+ start:280 stop:552 length:273 start_codon:yes stop_codon:yes gene_type:complete